MLYSSQQNMLTRFLPFVDDVASRMHTPYYNEKPRHQVVALVIWVFPYVIFLTGQFACGTCEGNVLLLLSKHHLLVVH